MIYKQNIIERTLLSNLRFLPQHTNKTGNTIVIHITNRQIALDVLDAIFRESKPRKRYLMMLIPEKFNVSNPGERYDFWIKRLIGKDAFKAAFCKTDKKWDRVAYFIWTDDATVIAKLSFVPRDLWVIIDSDGWCYDTQTKTAI